jgi:hypothetical protein
MCDSQTISNTIRALPQKTVDYHHFASALLDTVTFLKPMNIGDCDTQTWSAKMGPDQVSLRAIEVAWILMNKRRLLGYLPELPKELKENVRVVEYAIYRLVDLNWISV